LVTGEGIKRTPSYETPLSRSELEKWRKDFWGKSLAHYNEKLLFHQHPNLTFEFRDQNLRRGPDLVATKELM
jgi:hypothetical protein